VIAQIVGYGSSFDGAFDWGYNTSAEGATRAIRLALESAELTVDDIDFIATL
jgi:3-oxoacyl-(acyl-carrier-protein) synthase